MTPHPTTINRESGPFQQRTGAALIVFAALLVLAISFLYGQKVRAAVTLNTATAVEDENRARIWGSLRRRKPTHVAPTDWRM